MTQWHVVWSNSVSRKAVTVSEWTVKINGVDRISVKPGECVEIGRKPLRPLADDGNTRLDVADQTKSMSKRHAMFTVKSNGTASVRDLGSTNGSYVVRENGDLLRLPANAEFLLPTSPMRMQFGDVPADFIRVDDPVAKPLDLKVPDLFGYAVHEAPQEPDAADMSVDDILDLRAGEPTAIFSADNVRRKVDELELGSLNITQPVTKNDEPAIPRDLFADALAQHAEQETERKNQQAMNSVALPKQQTEPESTIVTPASKHSRISGIVPVDPSPMPLLSTLPAQASRQWRRRRLLNPMWWLAQASQPKTFSPLRIPGMPAILSRRTLSNSMLKLPSLKPPGKPKPLNLKTPSLRPLSRQPPSLKPTSRQLTYRTISSGPQPKHIKKPPQQA